MKSGIVDLDSVAWAWEKVEAFYLDKETPNWHENVRRTFRALGILAIIRAHEKEVIPYEVREVIYADIWMVQVMIGTKVGWGLLQLEKGYPQGERKFRLIARTEGAGDDQLRAVIDEIAAQINEWSINRTDLWQ